MAESKEGDLVCFAGVSIALQPNFMTAPNACSFATASAIVMTTGQLNLRNVADPKITSS